MSDQKKAPRAEKAPKENKAEAKAKAELEEKNKAEAKAKADKSDLQAKLAEDLEARAYVPKNGTGKHFHCYTEIVQHNKSGKKTSTSNVSVQSFETFLAWIKQASRGGYSIGMAHDPFRFYPEAVMNQIKEALKGYARTINIENFEYGCRELTKGDGIINGWLNDFYKKRIAHSEKVASEAKKKTDIFD